MSIVSSRHRRDRGRPLGFKELLDKLVLPTEPGLGYQFDDAALARLDADAWQ